jgi:hypothetical protein
MPECRCEAMHFKTWLGIDLRSHVERFAPVSDRPGRNRQNARLPTVRRKGLC